MQVDATIRTVRLMTTPLRLLVFSDLDGTLLSHDTYAWDAAQPALKKLAQIGAGVVLASSKTAPEIDPLRHAMGLANWPAIVENGAGILAPGAAVRAQVSDYARLRDALLQIDPKLRALFRGFGDMSPSEVVAATGLPEPDAILAKARSFSEPGLWSGDTASEADFVAALADVGVFARHGGRFLTLSFGQTKADRMKEIIARYQPDHTIALGDAPNDVEMLEAADFAVIIHNPHRAPLPPLSNEDADRTLRTTKPGPGGWHDAVQTLIQRLHLN